MTCGAAAGPTFGDGGRLTDRGAPCHAANDRVGAARRLDRVDRLAEACAAYDRVLELVHSNGERRFLEQRRAEVVG